ncbi:Hexokinase [Trichinella patagoniensis]|uniref:Phosphotransferase n=1 Tax=Trichinella patagoniensis TaxID=990121 RepID=A0A0V1A0P9_9BILA|nr:Hexokinase [Trichinella patagoniensis]
MSQPTNYLYCNILESRKSNLLVTRWYTVPCPQSVKRELLKGRVVLCDSKMELPPRVREVLEPFHVRRETLQVIRDLMVRDFQRGLEVGAPPAASAMLPSFVPVLPNGTETGKSLSMDLSGKNLRVLMLQLQGTGEKPQVTTTNFLVPKEVMIGTGVELFDFMVNCLHKFLAENNLLSEELPLGFVFSYPVEMKGIRSAKLLWWTKGFNVKDCLNQDVGTLLQEALNRKQIKVKVKAIMNDSVAELASAAHCLGKDCTVGVVVGYGCNSAYLEKVSNIKKLDAAKYDYHHEYMVIDTEWEEFGRNGELDMIKTTYDKDIDQHSVHKGKQIIDKFTGAFFLGELVRLIIDQFCVDGFLFGGSRPEQFVTPEAFPTKYVTEILSDELEDTPFVNVRKIMDELRIPIHGISDYMIIKEVCHAVTERSASVVAAAIAALLKVQGKKKVVIGLGGALFQNHPTYLDMLKSKLDEVIPPEVTEWNVCADEHGSAFGAAVVALVTKTMSF